MERKLAVFIILLHPVLSLVGYDCSGQSLNITTFSLLEVGACEVTAADPMQEEKAVQLLQLSEYDNTMVIQCKVEIDRTIYYCGMQSHISIVHNGRREYLLTASRELCTQLHTTGMMSIGTQNQIVGLKTNQTDFRSITLAGAVGTDGTCSGAQYSDPYGTWDNVVVQASVKITLQSYEAAIKLSTNQIILRSGLHCAVSDGNCLDTDGGDTFWSPMPTDSCQFNKYDVLFEGKATKLSPKEGIKGPVIYTVTTHETTFALARTTEISVCGYTLQRTEHPKLFIMETTKGNSFRVPSRISINNLDIFAYINSKFIYVEKHLKTQMTQLYHDLMRQKCKLEEQILKNALALASIAPDEVAYAIMKNPGYMATPAGEAIHVIKCIPITCKLRQTDHCYQELPVTYQNASLFLTPRSRILTKHAAARECNELLPIMYRLHGAWYRLSPKPIESLELPKIQPLTQPEWKYSNPEHLASSGIYNSGDLDKLRDHIMFPVEKPSMLHTLARGAMGQDIPPGSISLYNLLDEKSLEKIAESTGQKLWSGFITFGSASAGVIAIIVLIRLTKLVADTIIQGYALHSIYGWSIHLLGAVWTSITHLLIHMADQPEQRQEERQTTTAETKVNEVPLLPARERIPPETDNKDTSEPKPRMTYAELSERLNEAYP